MRFLVQSHDILYLVVATNIYYIAAMHELVLNYIIDPCV